jgi:hypothetical protein
VTDGNGGTDTQTFTVSTVDDAANSPPVLQNLPPMTVAKNTELDFPLKHFDLEGDYVFFNHGLLSPSTSNIETSQSGPIAKILGTSDYVGPARMGFEISQFNVGQGQSESAIVQSFVPIGIGDRAVRDEPMSITATPGTQFSGVVARFQDLDPAGAPTDFTTPASNTTINWGDGSAVQNGTVAQDTTVAGPANYAVSGAHTFARAGIYTIVATMTGNNGAIGIARTQAVVSSATILPLGENLDVKGPTLANRIVATFTDSNAPGRPADYTATVDWGDGQSSKGVISLAGDKSYVVRGTHVYKDAEPFAISVKISKAGAADAFAWSTANVSGFAPVPHLPPFPLAHLTAAWNSGPTKNITAGLSSDPNGLFIDTAKLTETFTGNFVVINSGSRASPVAPLRYLLSRVPLRIANFSVAAATVITTVGAHGLATGDDVIINGVVGGTFTSTINGDFTATVINSTQFTVPVTCASAVVTSPGSIFSRTAATDGATPLSVNKVAALQVASFAPGAGGSGNFTIALPKGVSPAGRYLLAQLVYSDPIIDASKVDKVVVSGPFNGVHVYNQGSDSGTSSSGSLQTTQKGGKAHFSVVLEAQPTANVTIALTSSNTAEGTVSPASLTFTTANWNRAQTVTVTGVGSSTASGDQSYTVTVQSPVSTDPRYSGAAADTISLVNVHNG